MGYKNGKKIAENMVEKSGCGWAISGNELDLYVMH